MLKKKKRLLLSAIALCVTVPALALFKTTIFSNNKNTIASDNSTKYDVVADLGQDGRFESGEFSRMPDGKWVYKYLPSNKPTSIPNPVKDGHTFEGWLVDGQITPPNYSIPAWHRKNVNLVARWSASESVLLAGPQFNAKVKAMPNFNSVTQIRFNKGTPKPDGIDLSEKQNGLIRGSITGNTLTVICASDFYINPDSSSMFNNFTNVTGIYFDSLDTSRLTNMSGMFSQCSKVTSLPLNQINTVNVTDMSNLFSGCTSITSLNVSGFNTSKVTNMAGMFQNCKVVSSLNVSNFNTSNVTDMSNMFEGCLTIPSLNVSNFNTSKVTNMSGMFAVSGTNVDYDYQAKLTTINGLNRLDTRNVTNMSHLFHGCVLVPSFNISNFNTSKVTDMSYMFMGCAEVSTLDVTSLNTSNVVDMQYMFSVGKKYDHPDPNAFQNHQSKLTTIRGLQGLNTSNVKNMYRMFLSCTEMTSLDLTGLDTSNVTNMGFLCSHMYKLRNLNIRNIDTRNVTNFEYFLFGCIGLPSVDLSGLDTSSATSIESMLSHCDAIRTFDVGTFDTQNVTNMEGVFRYNMNLTNVVGLNRLNMSKVKNARRMFMSCANLPSINIRGWDTSSLVNMQYMFRHDENLQRVYGLENINTSSLKCVHATFWECRSLTAEMTIMSEIPDRYGFDSGYRIMFQNCSMNSGTRFTLHYKAGLRDNAQKLVDTKEYYCNVYLGREVYSLPAARSSITPKPVNLTLNNGTAAQYPKQVFTVQNNTMPQLSIPELNPRYAGHFGGYYYDPQFTKPVKAGDIITKDLTIYARW